MVEDKKDHLEKLTIDERVELLIKLLENMGIKAPIRVSENVIEATVYVENVGTFKNCYMLFSENLQKNFSGFDNLVIQIDKKTKSGCSKIILVNSDSISTSFKNELERKVIQKNSIDYWPIYDLLEKIENKYPDYWRHNDLSLISYETSFELKITESFEIKKLVEYKAAYQKLISIFIEPNLYLRTVDRQSTKKTFTKITLDRLIAENNRLIMLHGDPGAGKTRLLNEIGRKLIEKNIKINEKRYLPIFIDNINIKDAFDEKENIDISKLIICVKISEYFPNQSIDDIIENYQLVLLVDSIDEFEENYKNKIIEKLEELMDKGAISFIGTRSNLLDDIFKISVGKDLKDVFIQKFNNEQVEKFTSRYFEGQGDRAKSLIESMKENKILEKLPLTPLNLSLMSILYEETNQEVPATLNDIYDKFSNLLLGRTMVDKGIDFLDITVKENILNTYALELLQRKNKQLMTKDEFFDFFNKKFSSISGTIDLSMLPHALDYIIQHTGLLILHKGKYVKFRHDSYMEYYAAKEIFKNRRDLECELIANFFDVNWQFAAIFYGGLSRQMPDFLEKIIEKVKTSRNLQEYWSSANGMGYLLQVLYLTEDKIRKNGVKEILNIMIDTYEWLKKITSSLPDRIPFSKFSLPVLSIFPIFLFQDNFDSITLKQPLSLALDELLDEYDEKKKIDGYPYLDNLIYKILMLSVTMSGNRLNMEDKLLDVIKRIDSTGNEFYTKLLEGAIDNLGSSELRKQKDDILKPKKNKEKDSGYYLKAQLDKYIQPASRQRFGIYDKITPNRKIKILTEGISDAMIFEHAYMVLTGNAPYWEIKVGNPSEGGAKDLADALNHGLAFIEDDQIVLGIFDNDSKGLQEFNGSLKPAKFDFLEGYKRIKKCKTFNIYGMLIPIPDEMQNYIQASQTDNYFSTEHYFPIQFLQDNNMIVKTAIPDIFRINDNNSAKTDFARKIQKIKSIDLFKGFIILFKEIDKLCGIEDIDYRE